MDTQTIVAVGLAAFTSPVIVKLVEHWIDAHKGRVKSRRTEVERAQLRADKWKRRTHSKEREIYDLREAFASLRVLARQHGVPGDKIPEWPQSGVTGPIDRADDED